MNRASSKFCGRCASTVDPLSARFPSANPPFPHQEAIVSYFPQPAKPRRPRLSVPCLVVTGALCIVTTTVCMFLLMLVFGGPDTSEAAFNVVTVGAILGGLLLRGLCGLAGARTALGRLNRSGRTGPRSILLSGAAGGLIGYVSYEMFKIVLAVALFNVTPAFTVGMVLNSVVWLLPAALGAALGYRRHHQPERVLPISPYFP